MTEPTFLESFKDAKKMKSLAEDFIRGIDALGRAGSAEQAIPRLQAEEAEWKEKAATAKQEYEANAAMNQAEAAKYEEAKRATEDGIELMKRDSEERIREMENRAEADIKLVEERVNRAVAHADKLVAECEDRKVKALEEVQKIEAHLAKVREEAREQLGVT